jgi:hypothetical protein
VDPNIVSLDELVEPPLYGATPREHRVEIDIPTEIWLAIADKLKWPQRPGLAAVQYLPSPHALETSTGSEAPAPSDAKPHSRGDAKLQETFRQQTHKGTDHGRWQTKSQGSEPRGREGDGPLQTVVAGRAPSSGGLEAATA